jgi:hypothetical protein
MRAQLCGRGVDGRVVDKGQCVRSSTDAFLYVFYMGQETNPKQLVEQELRVRYFGFEPSDFLPTNHVASAIPSQLSKSLMQQGSRSYSRPTPFKMLLNRS